MSGTVTNMLNQILGTPLVSGVLASTGGSAAGGSSPFAGAGEGHAGFWLGKSLGASEQAASTEWLFMFIMWVCIISFVLMMTGMAWLMFKYRRSAQATNYQVSVGHNTLLELGWTVIPFIVMVPIFWWGFTGYVGKIAAPTESEDIYVRGYKWNWDIKYASGTSAKGQHRGMIRTVESIPEFVVPAGRSVRLSFTSSDVIHAFYIPSLRAKMDVLPNRTTTLWFKTDEVGLFHVFCAEYCGVSHSEMAAMMRVVPMDEYRRTLAKWSEVDGNESIVVAGAGLRSLKGCASCHSIDGKAGTGPSWKDIWGKARKFTDGGSAVADDNYLREAILYPGKHIVEGYANQMPSYAGQLKDEELWVITRYIQALGDPAYAKQQAEMKMFDLPADGKPEKLNKK
jgi:cytochrome c oxidase subunit II